MAMNMGYLVFAYMLVGVFLGFGCFFFDERLKRYVNENYPEKGTIIRSYEWQWYPWSIGRRTLRALIDKQSISNSELLKRAKRAKRINIYFLVWFSIGLIMFFTRVLFFLLK